jgi:undecaprenyl-diphosphatase
VAWSGAACPSDLDQRLFDALHDDGKHARLDAMMTAITRLGDSRVVLLGTAGVLAFGGAGARQDGTVVGVSWLASMAATEAAKRVIRRERPLNPGDRRSMPSGHATAAFAVATALSHRRRGWAALLYGGASVVAVSRVYLGRHYPSDVLAGAAVGTLVTRIVLTQERALLALRF